MAKLKYTAALVEEALKFLELGSQNLNELDSKLTSAITKVSGARGIEYVNMSLFSFHQFPRQ